MKESGWKCRPHCEKTTRVSRNAAHRRRISGKGNARVAGSPGMKSIEERCIIRVAKIAVVITKNDPEESARVVK